MNSTRRRSPALRIDIHPQPRLQGLIAALAALAALCAGVACVAHQASLWPCLILLLPASAGFAWRMAKVQACRLQWDGQVWRSSVRLDQDADSPQRVSVVMDMDRWMLLRLQPLPARWWRPDHFVPVSAAQQGAQWGALRATLFSAHQEEPSVNSA
ncbi:hypothetical protein [Roseateles koreensis]|uniref:Toxin CptA n=1 Tax=Roseateles koreensis TaxID=2987526 RepID=A0ABT5KME8_9BURK|nr:hypothetical protein [Roseateles koreensis]MDC8784080.1 hypothetical protein [Roseateles koreensis]